MNFLMIDHLLPVMGMIADPDKDEEGKAGIVFKYLGANVYGKR
jgi:hypothetical protein